MAMSEFVSASDFPQFVCGRGLTPEHGILNPLRFTTQEEGKIFKKNKKNLIYTIIYEF